MSYHKNAITARKGYGAPTPLAGTWSKIENAVTGAAKGAINFYGQSQRDAGAAQLAAQQAQMQATLPVQGTFFSTRNILLAGGAVAAFLLLRR